MIRFSGQLLLLAALPISDFRVSAAENTEQIFKTKILPALEKYCFDCHEPGLSEGDVEFLEGATAAEIQKMRGVWRSVGSQMKNRTMPPPDKKNQPTNEERARISEWINSHLRETAFDQKPYAGNVTPRRLNRLEYNNTIRDLVGVDLNFDESLPVDGGAGEGFDNNGESLFLQPMLMERYLEAAQQIVDAAIVPPPFKLAVKSEQMRPKSSDTFRKLDPGANELNEVTALVSVYTNASYSVTARIAMPDELPNEKRRLALKVDGLTVSTFVFDPKSDDKKGTGKFLEKQVKIRLSRGAHVLSFTAAKNSPAIRLREMWMSRDEQQVGAEQKKIHEKLLATKVGHTPEKPREKAEDCLQDFAKRAFRRPVDKADIEPFMALFDRAMDRGDPWEECVKLALKGVLVSPKFLFRVESAPESEGIEPLSDHEMATRLSYFFWATMPDAELTKLADEGKLTDPAIYRAQVNRLLDDPRSRVFARSFIGQWLGTKEVGGRVAPITNELQKTYTPELAENMRDEAVELFRHLLVENRPLTEIIDADYTFLTQRLGEHYQLKDWKKLPREKFQKVSVGERRGGVLGMASVLALTSHYKKTSPILRGAWVFDTLIGDPVPPPPADVPELREKTKDGKRKLSDREKIEMHREQASCMACHQLIDPIGFALQNYDYLGKWRETDQKQLIDATGVLPSGEAFSGPGELKAVLLKTRKSEFLRQISRKLLGHALGRNLNENDDGTVERLVRNLEENDAEGRALIHGITTSVPFKNQQKLVQ